MNFSAFFIHRPIATSLLMAAIVLLGLIGYELLPVAALPEIDSPTIQVTAQLPGADPQTMASSVATQLERQFGEIPGLTQMTSSSAWAICRSRSSSVAVDPLIRTPRRSRRRSMQRQVSCRRISSIRRSTERPNPADTPILLIALTSDSLPITKVSDYANSILAQKLSQVPGVGLVSIGGEQNPAIRVQVNPAQLAAEGLDLESVRTALTNSTVNQPKGILYGGEHAYALSTNDQLLTASGFDDYILAYVNGSPGPRPRCRPRGGCAPGYDARRLVGFDPNRPSRDPAPARRQCDRDRRPYQKGAAAARGLHSSVDQGSRSYPIARRQSAPASPTSSTRSC